MCFLRFVVDFYVIFVSLFIYYIGNFCEGNGSVYLLIFVEVVNVDNIDVLDYILFLLGSFY